VLDPALYGTHAAPGPALAQWTHFVTSVCNARCAHCFYPINAGKNELTLEEIERAHVKRVLARAQNLEEAASILGIDASTLWRKRKKFEP